MKKWLGLVTLLFCGFSSFSQAQKGIYTPVNPSVYGSNNLRVRASMSLGIPEKDALILNTDDQSPQVFYYSVDSSIYGWSKQKGFFKVGSGGGSSTGAPVEITSGTVAQLKSFVTSNGKLYSSTDRGGGVWLDEGLNDGAYSNDDINYIITANDHRLKRQNSSGAIDITWFGARGDSGLTDNVSAITAAFNYAKTFRNKQSSRGENVKVIIPAGKFYNSGPLYPPVGVDIYGLGQNSSILYWKNKASGGLIYNDLTQDNDINPVDTRVEGLGILGGSFGENPFGAIVPANYVGANGIEVHNHGINIYNCEIQGWNESGITYSSSYYNKAVGNNIINNKVGVHITAVSTSTTISDSKIRLNSVGVLIDGNSFGNYVKSNKAIEANYSHYMPLDNDQIISQGKAIVLTGGARANYIEGNYIEAHITTFSIANDLGNHFLNNTIIIGLPDGTNRSDLVTFYGQSSNDVFENNEIITYNDTVPATIRIADGNMNFSSTHLSFSKDNYTKIVNNNLPYLHSVFLGVENNAPIISNSQNGESYKGLLYIPSIDETLAYGATYAKWHTTGNGSTDNTLGLQRAINKGGNVILTESYVVSNTLTVPSNTHIIGMKGASIFLANNTNKILFNIADASNVSIEGLTLDGNITNQNKSGTDPLNLPESWSGINMLNSSNVVIENCIIKNFNGDGITMEGRFGITAESNLNRNIKIRNNEIIHCGRNGVSAIHVDGFEIESCKIHDQKAYTSTLGSGIDIEPNIGNGSEVWIARNGVISRNTLYDNNEGIMLAGSAVVSSQVIENIKIETNSIYSNKNRNIYAYSLDATKFKTSGVLISSNNFKGDSSLTNSIFINGCHSNININNNDFSNAITPIFVYRSSEANLVNNTIEGYGGPGGGSGIELYGSSNNNLKLNKIKNGNFSSNFLYGIGITSVDATFLTADNNIEGNEISVTVPNKYMFAGIVAVSNNPVWDVIKRNKINGNTFDGITAANTLFVNCKTKDNQIGVNFTQSTPLVPDHSINALVPYNFTADKPTATTDLPIINNDEGNRRFDNIKHQPTWFNGSKWVTGVIEGYNYGSKEISKTLTSTFPDGVANQKLDVLLPSASFLGDIDVTIQSGFMGNNAAGVIKKKFSVGYNPGGSIYSNNSRYTEASGEIKDNFSISDLVWDATASKFKITVNHLTPVINPLTVKIGFSSIDTGSTRIAYDSTVLGSVYIGSPSVADAQVEYKSPVRGVPAINPNEYVIKSQIDNGLVKNTDTTIIYTGTYITGTGQSSSPLDVDVSKIRTVGTGNFTGDGTTTQFTFVANNVPGLNSNSRIFTSSKTPIGAVVEWVEASTESFTIHFLTAPSAGAKTIDYIIIP